MCYKCIRPKYDNRVWNVVEEDRKINGQQPFHNLSKSFVLLSRYLQGTLKGRQSST